MTELLVHLDEAALEAAREALGTESVDETVNAALRLVRRNERVERGLELLRSGAFKDATDPEVLRSAWR